MSTRKLRNAFYGALNAVGLLAAWRWMQRDALTVVCIHGARTEDGGTGVEPSRWQIQVSELDRQLKILTKKYEFITLEQVEQFANGALRAGKPRAFFTIDDGYRSAYDLVWPVLQRHQVPAVVFVATGHMDGGRPFWWDRLDYVFLHLDDDVKSVKLGDNSVDIDLRDRKHRGESARYVTRYSRKLFEHERDRFRALEGLIQANECPDWRSALESWVGVMTASEVARSSSDGLGIGSHTIHHYRLGDLDRDTVRTELCKSKSRIEDVTGKECQAFCYPEGSLNSLSREEVERAGFKLAFCSESGLNSPAADRFALRRIHLPPQASKPYLLARVSGLTLALSRMRSFGRKAAM